MATARQVEETVARCVSTMVCYHNLGRSPESSERMTAEIQVIVGFIEDSDLTVKEVETLIVRAVEEELIDRYGHEVGPQLFTEFADAFEGT